MSMLHAFEMDALLDTVPNPVFIKDEKLRFVFINTAYEDMFNVKRSDVLGKLVLDLEYLPMEDRIFYQKEDEEILRTGTTHHHIFDYLHQGKETHTCLYWTSGFQQKNGVRGVIGVIVDINNQEIRIQSLRHTLRTVTLKKWDITKKSILDALTQLYTRRAFDEALQHAAATEDNVFSFIMFDIDHFKQVNDTFGHPAGDAVLREAASCLKKCSRKPDSAYRYGGEEFAVLLPGTVLDDALVIAERIRRHISENVRLPDGRPITVSAGCSERMPGESGTSVVQRADKALYAAKNSGRNRVCSQRDLNTADI